MDMLKSEQESMDMSKMMIQPLEGCSNYLNGLSIPRGNDSPSPSNQQSINDIIAGLVNPSQLMANNMDSTMASALLEQIAQLQSQFPQFLTSQSLPFLANQSLPTSTTTSKEFYCDLCDKAFKDWEYLNNHRRTKHGIDEKGSPIKGIDESSSPMEGIEGARNSSVIRVRSNIEGTSTDKREEDNDRTSSMEISALGGAMTKSGEGSFEKEDLLAVIQQNATNITKIDNDVMNTVNSSSPSFNCNECDMSFDSPTLLTSHISLVHGNLGNILNMFGGGDSFPAFLLSNPFSSLTNTPPAVKPPPSKRNYSSAGKNYCDVCNKEVCNKYFLRTHMLKMHGIVIDENKPVIANIDTRERERTGELTFRCDICSTTLSSRQQLRDHKQNEHGVSYPVGTPSVPSASSTLSTPTRPIKTQSMFPSPSIVPPINSSLSSINLSTITESSSSIDQTHPQSIVPDLMASLPTPSVVRENGLLPQAMTKCQHCIYTTRFARNMEYHVERHERLNESDGMRNGVKMEKMEIVEREDEIMDRSSEDSIMRMTTNAAIHMAKTNETNETFSFECTKCHRSFTTHTFLHSHNQLFHTPKMMNNLAAWIAHKRKTCSTKLGSKMPKKLKRGIKKNIKMDKENDLHGVERHSVTSGSISPLRSDIPEGISSCDNGYSLQSVVVSTPFGLPLPSHFNARLPLSSPLHSPLTITLTLTPFI